MPSGNEIHMTALATCIEVLPSMIRASVPNSAVIGA